MPGLARPAVALLAALAACGSNDAADAPDAGARLPREALMDPETCRGCHPAQYESWAGSMHAYAAEDPVFRAMNARGQRETDGALGDFCVQCHAPVAVREGLTTDGLNLDEVPRHLRGVTCWFCHQVEDVAGTHNNPLVLADDGVLRGGIADPRDPGVHDVAYSPFHDRRDPRSAELCGACHDIVTPAGVHLERTFQEWQGSVFAQADEGRHLTCGSCHMPGRPGRAAEVKGAPVRLVHDHGVPGVDLALTPFPHAEAQREAVQAQLDTTLLARLCATAYLDGVEIEAVLENAMAGHAFPSGAAQDRRAWLEVVARRDGEVIFETGRVPADEAVAAQDDPDLWILRDRIFDDAGREVHMFWDARRVESELLPPAVTSDPTHPDFDHSRRRAFRIRPMPDRVEMRVHLRPMGREVLEDLVATGDLDPVFLDRLPTFTLASTEVAWTPADGFECVP